MGTETMKGSGWDLKKIKRIETEAEQSKAWKADMAAKFSCEPAQIKSYCKTQEEERARNYETQGGGWQQRTRNWRGAATRKATPGRGPRHWMQDRKGRVGTHLCGRSQPCEADAPWGHLSRVGTAGNGGEGSTVGGRRQDSCREKKKKQGNKGWGAINAGRTIKQGAGGECIVP